MEYSHVINEPLVSVIMNCYNCNQFLNEAVDSVVTQTYTNWEIIFWDNQSSDNSKAIIESYDDHRIKYYRSEEFTPLGEARNLAINRASGEYIAFLDADDIWLTDKLSMQIPLFENENVGIVISNTEFFNNRGQVKRSYGKSKPPVGRVFNELLGAYFISLETAVIRRKALDTLDHWFDNRFNMIEEYDLFVRLAIEWELDYVDEVLARWRVHANSWTWKHNDLFPGERKLMLDKLENLIPSFNDSYSKEVALINRTCALEQAQIEWKNGDNRAARDLISPYRSDGMKWLAVYYLTWLPYDVFDFVWRLKGSLRP